uniref:SPK domain-containing protein n=1 Tax=Caenorhabditis tropicalis TaxID=1561998 RepID=A0A1I7TSI9_9PELO
MKQKPFEFSETEYGELLELFIEKAREATKRGITRRLNLSELVREWKKRSRLTAKNSTIDRRLRLFRLKINTIRGIDMETRVRVLFALSVPVDEDLLREMREDAEVTLDDGRRIVSYEQYGGGLWLSCNRMDEEMEEVAVVEKAGLEHVLDSQPVNLHDSFLQEIDLESDESGYMGGYAETWNDQLYEIEDEDYKENIWKPCKQELFSDNEEGEEEVIDVVTIENEEEYVRRMAWEALRVPKKKRVEVMIRRKPPLEKHVSLLKVLQILRDLIQILNLNSLSEVLKTIEEKIDDTSSEKTTIENLLVALRSSWYTVVLNSPMSTTDQFTSVKGYLETLSSCLARLQLPHLDAFQQKLKEDIQEYTARDKMVSAANVREAMEMILHIID